MATSKKQSSIFLEILRFIVVGVVATIVDYIGKTGCAYALSRLWDTSIPAFGNLSLGISVFAGFLLGVIVNYILSLLWVFQDAEDRQSSGKRFWLFFFLGAIGWLISEVIFYIALYLLKNWSIDIQAGNEALFTIVHPATFWQDVATLLSDRNFVAYTIVFIISTIIVLAWNYLSRKKWVFKSKNEDDRIEKDIEEESKELLAFTGKNGLKEINVAPEEADAFLNPEDEKKLEEASANEQATKPNEESNRPTGKYEVFPEAGYFKYRLKANNGEILVVSHGYKNRKGAYDGIENLKKNIPDGVCSVVTDKNGFSQWKIFTPNGARLIASGETYSSKEAASDALNSLKSFYDTIRIEDVEEIPENETHDWVVSFGEFKNKPNGKIIYFVVPETGKWKARLLANNGQVLFETDSSFVSKNGAIDGISTIKNRFKEGNFHVIKDKQGRYQFAIYSPTGSILLRGESYLTKNAAISAAISSASFLTEAKEDI